VEDLDDLIKDILQGKPQVKKPGAFSLGNPKKENTRKTQTEETEDSHETSLTYKRVSTSKRKPHCGTCRAKLKGGTWHWYYKDDAAQIWWWCYKCMASIDVLPDHKEKAREQRYPDNHSK
jgi:hypothetical protein